MLIDYHCSIISEGIFLTVLLSSLLIVAKLIEIYQRQQKYKQSSTNKVHTEIPEFARVTPYNMRVLRGDVPVLENASDGGDFQETVFKALDGIHSMISFLKAFEYETL